MKPYYLFYFGGEKMELLTPGEAAQLLKIKKAHLYSLVQRREIPYFRIGRLLRFDGQKIIEHIAQETEPGRSANGPTKDKTARSQTI